jgi:hypothetical protein
MTMRSLHSAKYAAVLVFLAVLAGCGTKGGTEQVATGADPVLHASIDAPAPGSQIKGKFVVGGWAFATGGVVQEISVYVDGKKAVIAATHGARPDVAQQFPEPDAAQSGWYSEIDGSTLAAGKHEISVRATLAGGGEKSLGTVSVTK